MASQAFIEAAREAFITDGKEPVGVRQQTVAAWRRSKAAGVTPTGTPFRKVHDDYDRESALLRAVAPVADGLLNQIEASEVAMMVTDRDACVVGRWAAGRSIDRQLDEMGSHCGASFDESDIGSTALGTVLEDGADTVVVEGAEHYNDTFDNVAAVGAPIIHPGTGVIEGVIDIVAPTGAPVGLMLPLASRAAKETSERLLSGYAREDRDLLDLFIQTERRGLRRPMIAVNSRMMLVNTHAGGVLRGASHELLWEQVERAIVNGDEAVELTDDSRGEFLLARIRKVHTDERGRGAVLQIGTTANGRRADRSQSPASDPQRSYIAKRLAGRSIRWLGTVDGVANALNTGESVLLVGPVGAGKSALAVTAARGWAETDASLRILDGASDSVPGIDPLDGAVRVLVVENLAEDSLAFPVLMDTIGKARHRGVRVIATMRVDQVSDVPASVSSQIAMTVEVPSLAHRAADIADLIAHWTSHDGQGCTVDADAVRILARRLWPGNVRQLFRVLDAVRDLGSRKTIRALDLPEAATHAPRRELTYLENVEREVIARLLEAADGRKVEVARELGVSRATLYRKLAALGLDS